MPKRAQGESPRSSKHFLKRRLSAASLAASSLHLSRKVLEKQSLERGSPTHSSLSTCRSPGMYGFIGSISQSAAMPEFLSSTPGYIALQSHLELLHLAPEDFIGLKKQINKFGSWKHGLFNILISYLVSSQRFWHQHRFENPEPLRSTYTLQALHSISAFRISASGWVWLFKRLQETFVQFHHSKSIPPNTKPIHGTKL